MQSATITALLRIQPDHGFGAARAERTIGNTASVQRLLRLHLYRLLHRITYDWIVTPVMSNHLSFGINVFDKDAFSANVPVGNWKSKVCIINSVNCNVNMGNVTFTDLSSWGTAADNGTKQPSWTLKDDFNYIHGAHTLKFGATYDHQEANGFGQQNIAGLAGFSFLETASPGVTTNTSGAAFASFLVGNADTGAPKPFAS